MARPSKHDGAVFKRNDGKILWITYRDRDGKRIRESTFTEDWQEAQRKLRERLQARDDKLLEIVRKGEQLQFSTWVDFFLENYSQPPIRAEKTHEANERAGLHLKKAFGSSQARGVSADDIELYLRRRLQDRVRIKTGAGVVLKRPAETSHGSSGASDLRRILNVAVRKKLLPANPCAGVEFPVAVKGLFRPHYMGWSEQQQIEFQAPEYLRNIIRIITETGLRVYKELMPMKKDQVDLENAVVWIPDSKTAERDRRGSADRDRRQGVSGSDGISLDRDRGCFRAMRIRRGHQKTLKTVWHATLRRAKVPYFRIYDLRSTYATRLSAGGVADEWVTQLLRQGDAKVFKKYSQMKLQMKREALQKLNRKANEGGRSFDTERPN